MSTTVIGIDPSLRRTGLARLTLPDGGLGEQVRPDRIVETWMRPSVGHRRDDLTRRRDRLVGIAADVMAWSLPCELVVIEGPSFGSGGIGSAWDRAGLWWRIVARLLDQEIPVAVVPPRCRAKWITGSGSASKPFVQHAITQLWHPHWQPTRPRDDNEADALVLASMGAQWLGQLPVGAAEGGPDPAVLAGAAWPERDGVAA